MIKIFLQDREMTLIREVPSVPPGAGVLMVHSDSVETTHQAWRSFLENKALERLLIVHSSPIAHLEELKKQISTIVAGGGLVENDRGELLMIFRKGKWDLPKGKLDEGESPEKGAVREVIEECGIPTPVVEGFFMRTYHAYEEKGEIILKETWWFKMKVKGSPVLTAQEEEGITDVQWVAEGQVRDKMSLCYSAIRELLEVWNSRL